MARISKLLRAAARQRVAKERKYVTSMNVTHRLEKATEHVARVVVYSVSDLRGKITTGPLNAASLPYFLRVCASESPFLRLAYSLH